MKIICMAFDGEYQVERPVFDTVAEAWEYANDLGSKWYFYPFVFVVSNSGRTIVDAPPGLRQFNGKRTTTVAKVFAATAKLEDAKNADVDEFIALLWL